MIQSQTRWAVFGTGGAAANFASDMRHAKLGRIVAIGSRSLERATAFAALAAPGAVCGSFDALLRRDDIDAVYVATPNDLHREHALAVIAAGKPALVEKPLATSPQEAGEIAEAARQAGVLAMEAMWVRFTPGIVRLKRLIDNGAIGEIRRMEISVSFRHAFTAKSRLFDPTGGGALLDLGIYPASLAVHLAGMPDSVQATRIPAPTGAVMAAGMLLRYPAAIATLSCGFDVEGANEIVIVGSKGIITAHRSALCPPMISLRRLSDAAAAEERQEAAPLRAKSRLARLPSLRLLASAVKTRRYPTLYAGSGLQYQADHFSECLRQGLTESPVMPLDQSIRSLEIIEQAQRA